MFASGKSASVSTVANYIEDVFSTYLYTGTGATQTITNGIDLSTKGGLVWIKNRNGTYSHALFDTARGVNNYLNTDNSSAQNTYGFATNALTAFNASGFSLGADSNGMVNTSGNTQVSWTLRKQPKFFDVVTWNGTGGDRTISHSLGSTPACIIVKRTDNTTSWYVYHRSSTYGQNGYLTLNSSGAENNIGVDLWSPTSTTFQANSTYINLNLSGGTYVAYLFAHDAGGFGASGNDNVISCGSFTTDGSGNATVNLGYEPQWLLMKGTNAVSNWLLVDIMRGLPVQTGGSTINILYPNSNVAEQASVAVGSYSPTATGFTLTGGAASRDNIYIAIRRGPMKVPTDGTSVFSPNVTTSQPVTITTPSAPDMAMSFIRGSSNANWNSSVSSRLTGSSYDLVTSSTASEATNANAHNFNDNQGFIANVSASSMSWNVFKRAPSFFDEVCYTGTSTAHAETHNLGVTPELIIVKNRSGASNWLVYSASAATNRILFLDSTLGYDNASTISATAWNNTAPTATGFTIGGANNVSGFNYIAYLFATCAGVSKVGSYLGNGTSKTIDCGFTAGARFVLIKRTDSTGDWYIWDTARGIVSGNDPHLSLNSTAAEVTTDDTIDTDSSGFVVNQLSATNVNVSSATYIYLAIA